MPFESDEDAIALANASSSVWRTPCSRRTRRARRRCADALDAGVVWVNANQILWPDTVLVAEGVRVWVRAGCRGDGAVSAAECCCGSLSPGGGGLYGVYALSRRRSDEDAIKLAVSRVANLRVGLPSGAPSPCSP